MKKINFEMGITDPRGYSFDHHGEISASNSFVAKMASVQLLEAVIVKDIDVETLDIELNHVGHLDDFVLHAIAPAQKAGKLRNLYAFACRVSCLDSLGPVAYKLLNRSDHNLVTEVYEAYQADVTRLASDLGIDRWQLDLDNKVICSKMAGELIVLRLKKDDYEEKEVWIPDFELFKIVRREQDNTVVLVETLSPEFNPIRASAWFYTCMTKVLIGFKRNAEVEALYDYTICARSAYDVDLTPLWKDLTEMEAETGTCGTWGGHSGAGGSPRKNPKTGVHGGSALSPTEVYERVKALLNI